MGSLRTRKASIAARPILQEYDAFTVDELTVNPAEFGNLANRTILWKSQKRVGGEADVGNNRAGFASRIGRSQCPHGEWSNLWKRLDPGFGCDDI